MVEVLSQIDVINGIFTLGMVIVNTAVGAVLIWKSRETKSRPLLAMGIALILLVSPWFTNSINFLLIISNLPSLTPELHLAMSLVPLPIANFAWMVMITDLLLKKRQKPILIIYFAYAVFFNVVVLTLLPIDSTLVGTFDSPIDTVYSSLISGLILVLLMTVQVNSLLFFVRSRRAESPEARLKATFFLISTTTFVVASILDSRATFEGVAFIIIIRFLLLLGAIEIYWAFLLPDYVKKVFIRSKI